MKKIIISVVGGLFAICFTLLLVNYIDNENNRKAYDNGEYSIRTFNSLGVTQSYIEPYNEGCMYYQEGDYEKAIEKFREALEKNPGHDNDIECSIRINLALSMIAPIDIKNANPEEKEAILVIIKEAKKVLCDEECAHMDDEDGHNKEAQKLKDELDQMEKELTQEPENGGNGDDNNTEEPTEEPKEPENSDDVQKQLEDIQNQSNQQRSSEMQEYGDDGIWGNNGYYDGNCW